MTISFNMEIMLHICLTLHVRKYCIFYYVETLIINQVFRILSIFCCTKFFQKIRHIWRSTEYNYYYILLITILQLLRNFVKSDNLNFLKYYILIWSLIPNIILNTKNDKTKGHKINFVNLVVNWYLIIFDTNFPIFYYTW